MQFDATPDDSNTPLAIKRAFAPLRELPCWGVTKGHGTFLTFEFGSPHLVVREPQEVPSGASSRVRRILTRRSVLPLGEWHLWIYCCEWRVWNQDRLVGDWSTRRRIARAAAFLNGQRLMSVAIAPRGVRTSFKFDLGGHLQTAPYNRTGEQWLLYEPKGKVLVLRAGRAFSHELATGAEASVRWQHF